MAYFHCLPGLPNAKPCRIFIVAVVCFCNYLSFAQNPVVANSFKITYSFESKDSTFKPQALKLKSAFSGSAEATNYIQRLPGLLISQGYPLASVDSTIVSDSSIHAWIYMGEKFNLSSINVDSIDKRLLSKSGFYGKAFRGKEFNLLQLQLLQNRLLDQYENEGYPFATIYLDSIELNGNELKGRLRVNKGPLYHIDSIRIIGKAKLNRYFLPRYLNIPNGSVYNKSKLNEVDQKILELPYLSTIQPSDLTMLGTGSVLNIYVQPRKSSQANFLIGVLPAANESKKLQLTADVNLDLKNLLGGGEMLLIKWQQLQPKSPRLNLGYSQPYIFRSAFGFDFLFDLFKKDSSFLQVNAQVGTQYVLSARQTGKLFIQWQNSVLLEGGVDTLTVKAEKKLPPNIDISSSSIGLQYNLSNTNYRYNPRSGIEFSITSLLGIKKVKRNNDIVNIKDPSFNYSSLYDSIKPESYQLRVRATGAKYFPMGKASTLKLAFNAGIYNSPAIFRNELFQIGGSRLLRGFDEESIYATRYGVATAEYRILFSLNSYLAFFADGGITKNQYQSVNVNNHFISAGIGLVYETKLGLLNFSYAAGKRDDVRFSLREASKLHFGYVNYF